MSLNQNWTWKSFINKVRPFAPAVSVGVVAACVTVSLSGYQIPFYELPEVQAEETTADEIVEESEKEEKEEIQTLAAGTFDLADGTYEGVGTGYKGEVKVAVQIKDKKIISIEILSSSDDDAFFNRAKGVIDKMIQEQKMDVDVVSGATHSSNGIIRAVKNALTGEKDEKTPEAEKEENAVKGSSKSISKVKEASEYKDGTYYGNGVGFGGSMRVKVVIQNGKIASISVVSHNDTPAHLQNASAVIGRIISAQSTNVDTVSGATYSSVGIIQAVRNALKGAAVSGTGNVPTDNNEDKKEEPLPITGTIPYKDGIYYGTGEGYLGDITVAIVIENHTIVNAYVTEHGDDEAFVKRAESLLNDVRKKQTADVDTVSGATHSSNGIKEAIREALKAADKATNGGNPNPADPDPKNPDPEPVNPEPTNPDPVNPDPADPTPENPDPVDTSVYKDGTYTGMAVCSPDEEMQFETYNLYVTITIENDKIVSVTDVHGDGPDDNVIYINRAVKGAGKYKGVVTQIQNLGTPDGVDAVTRATCASNAIVQACKAALQSAKR